MINILPEIVAALIILDSVIIYAVLKRLSRAVFND